MGRMGPRQGPFHSGLEGVYFSDDPFRPVRQRECGGVILIYVSFRFEWRFAIASILALVHDITIALGAIALFQVDVNLDILAAILTILGYSLNDTIIVFDRIREGVETSKENELEKVVNESVSQTLSRTTLTSLTTFFVVLTLFLFGGEIINGFSFTLLIGIIVGTYSSIFVAASLLVQLNFSILKSMILYSFLAPASL